VVITWCHDSLFSFRRVDDRLDANDNVLWLLFGCARWRVDEIFRSDAERPRGLSRGQSEEATVVSVCVFSGDVVVPSEEEDEMEGEDVLAR
jgi:hypothetical protein